MDAGEDQGSSVWMNEMTFILGGRGGEMSFWVNGEGKVTDCSEGLWHLMDTWVLDPAKVDALHPERPVRFHIKSWGIIATIDGYSVKDVRKRY